MRLTELIKLLDNSGGAQAVLYEYIHPYRKLLKAYFEAYYTTPPLLIPVAVFNAAQYCLIAPEQDVYDAIFTYDSEAVEDEELLEQYTQYIQIL